MDSGCQERPVDLKFFKLEIGVQKWLVISR